MSRVPFPVSMEVQTPSDHRARMYEHGKHPGQSFALHNCNLVFVCLSRTALTDPLLSRDLDASTWLQDRGRRLVGLVPHIQRAETRELAKIAIEAEPVSIATKYF
jgi:hypothetical protein